MNRRGLKEMADAVAFGAVKRADSHSQSRELLGSEIPAMSHAYPAGETGPASVARLDKFVDLLCDIFPVTVAVQQYCHRSISNDVMDEVAGGNAVILLSLEEETCVGMSRAGIDQRLLFFRKNLPADNLRP